VQRLFQTWITQRIPLLQQWYARHGCQCGRRPTASALVGVMWLDQRQHPRPRNNLDHLAQKGISTDLQAHSV